MCIIKLKKVGDPMKRFTKLLMNTALFASGALCATVVTDRALEKKEKENFIQYGFKVGTRYGGINVDIQGEKGPFIILLSGYGTASPILDFKPLAKELSRFAKVVTIEYLGYGYSDRTERVRTMHNINDEVHEVLQRMNINKYWLMPHSISGVYCLDYVRRYSDEVQGLLMIDPSHPEQVDYFGVSAETKVLPVLKALGMLRIIDALLPGKFSPESNDYDPEDLKQIKAMHLWHENNFALKDEGERLVDHMNACRDVPFPKDLPVLMFISSENVEMTKGWWEDLHKKQLSSTQYGKMVIVEGSHYLHWTKSAELAKESKQFILETLQRKLEEAQKQEN